jgi:hypothetical protein
MGGDRAASLRTAARNSASGLAYGVGVGSRAFLILLLAAQGCGSDREGQTFDGGREDLAGADLTPPADLAILDGGIEPGCPRPVLLTGVEQLNQSSSAPGRVMRFALDSNGGFTPCTSLTAGGKLPKQPMAVSFVAPDQIAAATRDGLWVMGLDDQERWHTNTADLPIDVFPLIAGPETLIAVGYWMAGSSSPVIDRVDAHRDQNAPVHSWRTNSAGFPLSFGVRAMVASPLDPGRIFALENPSVSNPGAATDVDPFTNTKQTYVAYPTSRDLISMYAFWLGGYRRVVWIDATANAVYYTRENNGNPALSGPIKCNGVTCDLVHAVPDPTDPVRFLALCATPGASTVRDIVRFSSTGGSCDVMYAGVTAGANTRLSRLAIALP